MAVFDESGVGPRIISPEDLETVWQTHFSPWVRARAAEQALAYEELTPREHDAAVLRVVKTLDGNLTRSGGHRLSSWEQGWRENLQTYVASGSLDDLAPRYFGKEPLVRWRQRYIRALHSSLEYRMFGLLLDWIIDEWLLAPEHVYEFGCGTGHNLLRVRERHPQAKLTGLDWAETSQAVIRRIATTIGDDRLESRRFDYFNPDYSLTLEEGATVITVASLEQTGDQFKGFIDYLSGQPIERVIHVEPISELLDPDNLLDYLSIRYFRARNYLNGLVDYLHLKESRGDLQILRQQRSFVGSFFIDGYSLVMWRPINVKL
jgi:SAM-dependent methyltransferase